MLNKIFTRSRVHLLLISIITLFLVTKGISDEGVVSPGGDMPRHMMNGVFFYDLLENQPPLNHIIEYTTEYFSRYPALSIGHHPLLPALVQVPFYAIFGISVFSARIPIVFFMLIAGLAWYSLIKSLYDEQIALLSTLLLITTPIIINLSRVVMSEIPTLALIILTIYFLNQYCRLDKRNYARVFVICAVFSVYSKHTAILMFPFYLSYFIITKGLKSLFRKEIIISFLMLLLLILPLVPLTLKFSQHNVSWTKEVMTSSSRFSDFYYVFSFLWQKHLTYPVWILSLISILVSIYQKRTQDMIFLLWIILFYIFSIYIGIPSARHGIYWIPAFCLLASTIIAAFNHRWWKAVASAVVIIICTYQFSLAYSSQPEYAYGYEEAAKYILENSAGNSVFYSYNVDTGFFIFFVRKHDPDHNMIVLRANKILATSQLNWISEDKISSADELFKMLDSYGVRFVIIEDQHYKSFALELLRTEVNSDAFILRKQIPIVSSSPRLENTKLKIYEYKRYNSANPDAVIHMDIPLINDSITVPISDLIHKKYQ